MDSEGLQGRLAVSREEDAGLAPMYLEAFFSNLIRTKVGEVVAKSFEEAAGDTGKEGASEDTGKERATEDTGKEPQPSFLNCLLKFMDTGGHYTTQKATVTSSVCVQNVSSGKGSRSPTIRAPPNP